MKILRGWLIVPLLFASSASLYAEESTDKKLDAILKEIKQLNERVRQLEIRVGRLTAEMHAQTRNQTQTRNQGANERVNPLRPADSIQLRRLKTNHNVESTIWLQQESPGSLLKDIHERERELRKRPFPADVIPY